MQSIDAQAELANIRRLRETARRQPYRRSRLMRYRAELVALRRAGANWNGSSPAPLKSEGLIPPHDPEGL